MMIMNSKTNKDGMCKTGQNGEQPIPSHPITSQKI
jgi:hypothetical protein